MYCIGQMRSQGVRKLYYNSTELVSALPGSVMKKVKQKLGMSKIVADVYQHFDIAVVSEYVTMAACVTLGKFCSEPSPNAVPI